MASEALLFAEEPTWGTWTDPDHALEVRSVNVTGQQPLMNPEETGAGRNDLPGAPGAIAVSGGVNTLLHPVTLPLLVRSLFPVRASVAAGTGSRSKLLRDDDVAQESFSLQKRYGVDRAESIKGCKITRLTLGARIREFATCSLEFVGKDTVMSGADPGTWADGSAAPAVVDPVPYPASRPRAFTFYQGVLRLGGTVALTAGELVVSGGTAYPMMDNIELTMNTNVGTDAYGINLGDRTIQQADEGQVALGIRFDPNWATSGATFYNAWKDGERAIVELYFEGPEFEAGQRYIQKWTLPYVMYSEGGVPELNRSYGLKRHTVQGVGYVDPTTMQDIGLVVQSSEDLAA
jgi:hypothetical protein